MSAPVPGTVRPGYGSRCAATARPAWRAVSAPAAGAGPRPSLAPTRRRRRWSCRRARSRASAPRGHARPRRSTARAPGSSWRRPAPAGRFRPVASGRTPRRARGSRTRGRRRSPSPLAAAKRCRGPPRASPRPGRQAALRTRAMSTRRPQPGGLSPADPMSETGRFLLVAPRFLPRVGRGAPVEVRPPPQHDREPRTARWGTDGSGGTVAGRAQSTFYPNLRISAPRKDRSPTASTDGAGAVTRSQLSFGAGSAPSRIRITLSSDVRNAPSQIGCARREDQGGLRRWLVGEKEARAWARVSGSTDAWVAVCTSSRPSCPAWFRAAGGAWTRIVRSIP